MGALSTNWGSLESIVENHPTLFFVVLTWSVIWKGVALWKSAQLSQKQWFVAILILNTAGLLEIGYLYFVARKYEVKLIEEE